MYSRTSKNRSLPNKITRRLELYQQQIGELSRNTIIPFVTTKFTMKQKSENQNNQNSLQKIQALLKSQKLAGLIIVNKISKLICYIKGRQFMKTLKQVIIAQKLNTFFKSYKVRMLFTAFNRLRKQQILSKVKELLLLLRFIHKKKQILLISHAFHKIKQSIKAKEKQSKQQKSNLQFQSTEQYKYNQNSHIEQSRKSLDNSSQQSFPVLSTTSTKSSPPKLKSDFLVKGSHNFSMWCVSINNDFL